MKGIRSLAIHLPQFHSIPENDTWWGKGFTEWTNVKKAGPLFNGHSQPHIPLNKEYYNLTELKSLHKQKDLAKSHGIYGFCFYHYWFNGKLLLEKPLEMILGDTTWDMPFCLCWANENWTRRWDGQDQEILIRQDYSSKDDLNHFQYFLRFFKDPRYISVNNKPVLIIYRSELFPDIQRTLLLWREEAIRHGFDGLYCINVESFKKGIDPETLGFDAGMDFQPDWSNMPARLKGSVGERIIRKLLKKQRESVYFTNQVYSYTEYVDNYLQKGFTRKYKSYPSIFPGWDNSPRRKSGAVILQNATPDKYGEWLKHVFEGFTPYSTEENFVFINAWNEWAEGNHLEPCEQWGYAFLEMTNKILTELKYDAEA